MGRFKLKKIVKGIARGAQAGLRTYAALQTNGLSEQILAQKQRQPAPSSEDYSALYSTVPPTPYLGGQQTLAPIVLAGAGAVLGPLAVEYGGRGIDALIDWYQSGRPVRALPEDEDDELDEDDYDDEDEED